MKPKTFIILIAFLINLALLQASLSGPARGSEQQSSGIFFPCCKKTLQNRPYCCQNCCYFRWDCLEDAHCGLRQ